MFHIFTINAFNPAVIAGSILVTQVLYHLMLGSNQNFPAFWKVTVAITLSECNSGYAEQSMQVKLILGECGE